MGRSPESHRQERLHLLLRRFHFWQSCDEAERYADDGGKEKTIDHPLYLLLYDEPNPEMNSFVFRETLMTHLLVWGTPCAQIVRNGKLCTILDCRLEDVAEYVPDQDNNEIPVPQWHGDFVIVLLYKAKLYCKSTYNAV